MWSREPIKYPFSTQLKALNIDFIQKYQKSALESQIWAFLDQIWPRIDKKWPKNLGKKSTTFREKFGPKMAKFDSQGHFFGIFVFVQKLIQNGQNCLKKVN